MFIDLRLMKIFTYRVTLPYSPLPLDRSGGTLIGGGGSTKRAGRPNKY